MGDLVRVMNFVHSFYVYMIMLYCYYYSYYTKTLIYY